MTHATQPPPPAASALPPGLGLHRAWLAEGEGAALLAAIDAEAWGGELKRRVQHYGFRYDYKRRGVSAAERLGPLPPWAARLAARLAAEGVFGREPDQVIVNEYQPGQGIAPHIDAPAFGPVVASLSLGSACAMGFEGPGGEALSLWLEPGSLLVLSGEARSAWRHGIAQRRSDVVEGERRPRGRRVSLTFRTVIARG
ncbi:MAG TPA: alpha-ketoglutarate-dependent dioxygenase AlkB [Polyangiaceae bacterium]|nr:alpha-ketoglutarate-dependent dioxygenase AlkB [Polyangiaceae bacterium]